MEHNRICLCNSHLHNERLLVNFEGISQIISFKLWGSLEFQLVVNFLELIGETFVLPTLSPRRSCELIRPHQLDVIMSSLTFHNAFQLKYSWLRLFPLRFSLSRCSNLLEAHYDRRWNNCCHTSARNTTKPSLILSKRFSHENILSANYKRPRMKSMFLYSKCNLNFDKCFCRILTIQNVQANCKSCWVN